MGPRLSRRRFLALAGAAALAYALGGSMTAYSIEVERIDYGIGKTILFAPDIHTHGRDRDELVAIAREARPDILVLGGDLWDRLTPSWRAVEDLVSKLRRAARTIIHVPGNHEHAASAAGKILLREAIEELESMGVLVLLDDKVTVQGITVAGLDWKDNPKHYEEAATSLGEADVTIAHSPDALPHLHPRQRLLLAGHTHGGQVCLPGRVSFETNSVYGYSWGIYRRGGVVMLLSRGAGEMIPPRLYCPRHVYIVS